jgi:hypothetical protein
MVSPMTKKGIAQSSEDPFLFLFFSPVGSTLEYRFGAWSKTAYHLALLGIREQTNFFMLSAVIFRKKNMLF